MFQAEEAAHVPEAAEVPVSPPTIVSVSNIVNGLKAQHLEVSPCLSSS